jgi:tetratricopeptide (TPR) repeat protein
LRSLAWKTSSILLLLLFSTTLLHADSPYETALARAMSSMYAIEYDKAALQFEEAIRVEPANPRAYLYLATTYWMKVLYLQNTLLTTAFGLSPDIYAPPNGSPCPPDLRHKFEDAVNRMRETAQALINVNPKNPEALFWLGMAEGSESVFIISVDRKLLAAKTHADKSFDLMELAFRLDATFKDPLFPMGMHMHLLGTRGVFTRMILKLMGYKVSKEEGRKFVEIAAAQARYVRDDSRLGLVLCDIREGRWQEAVGEMQNVLKKYPQDSLLTMAMGRIQASLGDYKGAVATFEQIRNNVNQKRRGFQVFSPGEIDLRLALALLGLGRPRDAQAAVERALQDKQATALIRAASLLTLGQCRDLLNNRQGAIVAYQAALALTPKTPSHDKAKQFLNQPYDGKIPPG